MLARTPLLAALLALPATAAAQEGGRTRGTRGYDGNIELVRPFFSPENLPGIDVPINKRGGSFRGGLAVMYANSPLVLYEFDEEVGSVVNNRFTTYAGLSIDVTRAFTIRAVMPLHMQWGSDVPRYAADGMTTGDASIGMHGIFYRKPGASLGLRLDAFVPTARRGFYAGERLPSLQPAFLAAFTAGRVLIASDLGANLRFAPVETKEELVLGHELVWNAGLRVNVLEDRLDVGAMIYSRFGFARFFGAGETSGEAMIDVAYKAAKWLWIDVAAGRGFTRGYGSSDFRGWVQLRFQKVRPEVGEEDVDPGFGTTDDPDGTTVIKVRQVVGVGGGDEAGGTREPDWAPAEFARITKDRKSIEIKDDIKFRVGTPQLLPESFPILDAVAELLNTNALLGHVVIEGHASSDGDDLPNYLLSMERARSIWEHLVRKGVHPSRISIRGMGEVMPETASGGYDDLQASRRVKFLVVHQHDDTLDPPPTLKLDLRYPWSGEPYKARQPTMPVDDDDAVPGVPAPRTAPPTRRETLNGVEFGGSTDDIDIDDGAPAGENR